MWSTKFGDQVLAESELLGQIVPPELLLNLQNENNQVYLDTLSRIALDPRLTALIFVPFEEIFPDLLSRWANFATQLEFATALSKVLPAAPYLIPSAEHYLLGDGVKSFPLQYNTNSKSTLQALTSELESLSVESIQTTLLTLLRLLKFNFTTFSVLARVEHIWALLKHSSILVRYLSLQIAVLYLNISDSALEKLLVQHCGDEPIVEFLEGKSIDVRFFWTEEAHRLDVLSSDLSLARALVAPPSPAGRYITASDTTSSIVSVAGIQFLRFPDSIKNPEGHVETPTASESLRELAVAIRAGDPVLIQGKQGSGKTHYVHHIAKLLGTSKSLISIHLGKQTDTKLLLGTYVSSEPPGKFKWKPGVLTTAVREGRWVLIEDLDQAPNDVLSLLIPLMQRRTLFIPNRAETIVAPSNFRIIATVRTVDSHRDGSEALPPTLSTVGIRLWRRVAIKQPLQDEIVVLINSLHPSLAPLSVSLVQVYESIRALQSSPTRDKIFRGPSLRQVGLRELLNWCARIDRHIRLRPSDLQSGVVSESLLDMVFMEAWDSFAGQYSDRNQERAISTCIAHGINLDLTREQYLLHGYIPTYEDHDKYVLIGRTTVPKTSVGELGLYRRKEVQTMPYAMHKNALRLLERISVCIGNSEPVLLVGETGTGKTTAVQYLARKLNKKLTVHNFSQHTESSDLMGGFQPVDLSHIGNDLSTTFDYLFRRTFPSKRNLKFLEQHDQVIVKKQWKKAVRFWKNAIEMAAQQAPAPPDTDAPEPGSTSPRKRRKLEVASQSAVAPEWKSFATRVSSYDSQLRGSQQAIFSFVEGLLVKAVRNGEWVLLDELNLASPETLESIADLMNDAESRSMLLLEKGGVERIYAHPDFRIFGCMNPATDVGKRDLPQGIRSRFTEFYVPNPDSERANVLAIVKAYLEEHCIGVEHLLLATTDLYIEIRMKAEQNHLVDGAGQKPIYSIRTLTRTLAYVVEIAPIYGVLRSLYEGFCMAFLTCLANESEKTLHQLIERKLLSTHSNARSLLMQVPKVPAFGKFTQFRHYWMPKGPAEIREQPDYIITPYVERNLLNLVRASATRRYPVLIQGPTSSGKTSMIRFLANKTGHKFIRINNHEHTDLQEYLGSYVSDASGSLKFQEGALIQAMRTGCWVILDELNLAPTDVLEALNRLLDDNREILIPETQEVVRPHKDFMLFATQNPPGLYAGRKVLSKAFRNRFIELHFDDIPQNELQEILQQRTQIAPSFATRIVSVYNELSVLRQSSRLFEQKQSFATLRDLFRWANRDAVTNEELARNGYMLLVERVRNKDEKLAVKNVIEGKLRVKISNEILYNQRLPAFSGPSTDIVWTKAMIRLYTLLEHAIANNEPVLLVGETGCGKTTVCHLLAHARQRRLETVNAHMNTETGDIIGAYRPLRKRAEVTQNLLQTLYEIFSGYLPGHYNVNTSLKELIKTYDSLGAAQKDHIPGHLLDQLQYNRAQASQLFEWVDGSLVGAMKCGDFFLLDEISLAEDSVLERLNSVLEPEREIFLAEKGYKDAKITAQAEFQFFATMNPGGDYGKKELSPALRNRFTEIWVPPMDDFDDVLQIARTKLIPAFKEYAVAMVQFGFWFNRTYKVGKDDSISIRDVISWIDFCNKVEGLPVAVVFQGALMVYIDTLGSNPAALLSILSGQVEIERQKCINRLGELTGTSYGLDDLEATDVQISADTFKIGEFGLPRRVAGPEKIPFDFSASTTSLNAMRVIRAMQLEKPILLEGQPGVGKTSLITAIAAVVGIPLVRINLSEETDMMDLFGTDVPAESGAVGTFVWREAPFLRAMQTGEWVLLDEMNLASQSVLEGLNSCLDHRKTVYVPELGKTFHCHPNFRLFAAQNPHHQGNGRKGLPESFVNRFTVVYIRSLHKGDLLAISQHTFPTFAPDHYSKVVEFSSQISRSLTVDKLFGMSGAPWEFNLRDTLRWLEITARNSSITPYKGLAEYFKAIVSHRFRTGSDVAQVNKIFQTIFESEVDMLSGFMSLSPASLQIGNALISRSQVRNSQNISSVEFLPHQLPILESILNGINNRWPCLLVGLPGSGKSSMIELLAQAAGAHLEVIPLNNDTETTDVVGGYEQEDPFRLARMTIQQLHGHIGSAIIEHALQGLHNSNDILVLMDALYHWEPTYTVLEEICQLTKTVLQAPISFSPELQANIQNCLRALTGIVAERARQDGVSFAWYDGALVRAVENGHWVILDNANLCNPSVLDRINSLLETKGALFLHEHTSADGVGRVITPHPDFRLFLTMDPRNGELSRAMRNRAIEIFVPPMVENHDDWGLRQSKVLNLIDQSSARTFTRVDFLIRHAILDDPGRLDIWLYHILGGTAHRALPQILSLVRRIVKDEGNQALVEVTEKAISVFEELQFRSMGKLLLEFKSQLCTSSGLDASFFAGESVHPMSNAYILNHTYGPSGLDSHKLAVSLGEVYDVTLHSTEMHLVLTDLLRYFDSNLVPQPMNRDSNGIGSVIDKETSLTVVKFFLNLNSTIRSWLTGIDVDVISGIPDESLWSIGEALMFLRFIFSKRRIDGLALQACSDRIPKLLNEVTSIWPDLVVHQCRISFQNLIREHGLGSGFSWSRVWKSLRKGLPQSEEGIVFLKKLKSTAIKFDEVSQGLSHPTSQILQLRLSFGKALEQIQKAVSLENLPMVDFEGVVGPMANHIDPSIHSFQAVFDMILRVHVFSNASASKKHLGIDDLNTLAYYSRWPTQYLHNLLGFVEAKRATGPDEGISLKVLFRQTSLDRPTDLRQYITSSCFFGAFLQNIIRTSDMVQSVHIGGYSTIQPDLSALSRYFLLGVDNFSTNYFEEFERLLVNKVYWICRVHSDLFPESTFLGAIENTNSAESLLEALESQQAIPDERWSFVLERYLIGSLRVLLANGTANHKSRARAHGLAWIYYAIGCLTLFIPAHPYDPALEESFAYEIFVYRQEALQADLSSLEKVTEVLSGSKENPRCRSLRKKMARVSWDAKVSIFRRSQQSDFEPLRQLLERLVSLIKGQQLQRFIQDLLTPGVVIAAAGYAIRENIRQILHQVSLQDDGFEDLTSVVEEFVTALELGILIACDSESETQAGSQFTFTPSSVSTTALLQSADAPVSNACERELQSLQTMALRAEVESIDSLGRQEFELLDIEFARIVRAWERKERDDAREREEATKMYHFKGLEVLDPDDDDAGVAEMFSEGTSEQEKDRNTYKNTTNIQELSDRARTLHEAIYLGSAREKIDISMLQRNIGAGIKKHPQDISFPPIDAERMVPLAILDLLSANTWLGKPSRALFNFYKDDNPSEVRKATDILTELKTRIADLVAQWPENDILRNASEKTAEMLELPLKTPVNSILAKAEGLHATIHEWEQVASKEFSLRAYHEALTNLIVSWRKLELQTWPSLFSQEESSCRQHASLWWFHVYKAVRTANEIEDQDIAVIRVGLAETLNTFLRSSTMGEFDTRLTLLKAMENQLDYSFSKNREGLKSTIRNVHRLNSQFEKLVSEHVSTEKAKLEKDMKEVILLASWKDTNVNALKDSTRRSHYQLYKVVKKYRTILATPVVSIAKAADLSNLEMVTSTAVSREPPPVLPEDQAICAASVGGWDSRPARHTNISSTVQKMQQGYTPTAPSQSAFAIVDQFSDHILQRAQELRNATPSKLTKENTTEVRRLQDAKRKAVSEALKSLRQMGFKSNPSQKELAGQNSTVSILGSTPAFDSGTLKDRTNGIDAIVISTLENLSQTRTVLSNIPADIPVPEFVRGSKYFEHGLSMILHQREVLAPHLKAFHRLGKLVGYIAVFGEQAEHGQERPIQISPLPSQNLSSIQRYLGWARENIEFALKITDGEAQFLPGDYEDLRTMLQRWKQWASDSISALKCFPSTFPGVILPQKQDFLTQTLKEAAIMQAEFAKFGDSNSRLRHITSYLQPWISTSQFMSEAEEDDMRQTIGRDLVSQIDNDIQKVCDTILALIQPALPDNDDTKAPNLSEKIVLGEHEKMLKARTLAGITAVTSQLEKLGSKLREASTADLAPLQALMRLASPIIIEYENICRRDLTMRLDFHRAICRLTHILSNFIISIGTNGFCAPSDGSAEAGAAGQLESGTGLGDGEGEEDISNDIAPDEDLSELANQKDEESTKKDYDAEDNAVENDDIDGMSESGPENSDDEEGDGEEGEEQDMDDEMGKVDDSHGLDSLDKDFWDNPAEEPQEEVDAGAEGKKEDTATSKESKPKKDDKQPPNTSDPTAEEMEQDDSASEASAEDESDAVEKRDNDNVNEHIPEVEKLDISDDFNLEDMEKMDEENDELDLSEDEKEDENNMDERIDDKTDFDAPPPKAEDEEMEDQPVGPTEDGAELSADESEKAEEEESEELPHEPTDEKIEDAPNESTAPLDTEALATATSSGNVDTDGADPMSSRPEAEQESQQNAAQETTVPSSGDGKGDSGTAEYSVGNGQGDTQTNEQRLQNGLKKLGDLLEKVLRTPMDILDSETSTGPKDEPQNIEETQQGQFEHAGEDNGKSTTQALGTATTEEAHTIDESMVVDAATNQTDQTAGTGEDDLGDQGAEAGDGKEAKDQPGFQETSNELDDVPEVAPSTPKDDLEGAMEIDVPRLIAKPKDEHTDAPLGMDIDDDDDDAQDPEHLQDNFHDTTSPNNDQAHALWKLYEDKTRILSLSLTEQLRLILEPTLSTKLRGDYRTGKRLNMKRIIPYIASDYKKDKIWMRRTKPSKRQYQVMIALDDSKSMSESRCVQLTFESIALVANALTHLEVGQLAMLSFGESTRLVHPFDQPFSAQAGARVFEGLSFAQTKTNMRALVETSVRLFREARLTNSQADLWQLELIISDGICEDHEEVLRLVRLAHFEKIVLIFVIIDAAGGAATAGQGMGAAAGGKGKVSSSILDMKEAVFTDQGDGRGPKLQVNRYMDTFPFSYYLIIQRIEDLPGMLSTALRQWFSQAAEASG
ncbi:hypothetical protein DRE_03785 [Drechslerella stenobrocha 248]|uniref:Midasin n=1 Tax=Drechslerella stenobrocha 248 TaxID=1043628 RepID=W7I4C6_9PEZI|nr:hypothetical protein DRE_03785 [Drechslerella stenobrocha 248]